MSGGTCCVKSTPNDWEEVTEDIFFSYFVFDGAVWPVVWTEVYNDFTNTFNLFRPYRLKLSEILILQRSLSTILKLSPSLYRMINNFWNTKVQTATLLSTLTLLPFCKPCLLFCTQFLYAHSSLFYATLLLMENVSRSENDLSFVTH